MTTEPDAAGFEDLWASTWGPGGPVAYRLRTEFPERWARIHTLPDARRIPTGPDDYAEIDRRHSAVLHALVSSSASEALLLLSAEEVGGDSSRFLDGAERATTVHDDGSELTIWAATVTPPSMAPDALRVALQPVLRHASDEETDLLLIADPGLEWLYVPYDGGADILTRSPEVRARIREEFSGWLSPRADGL